EVNDVYQEFKYRYHQLMSSDYFRRNITKDHNWITEIEKFSKQSDEKLKRIKNVSFAELKNLALAYSSSNGRETKSTTSIRTRIEKQIAPDESEKKQFTELLDGPKFEISFTPEDVDKEIKRVINRYKKIDRLYSKHFYLRDSLKPLFWEICPDYYKLIKIKDSIEKPKVDSIINSLISKEKNTNALFINETIRQRNDTSSITIDKSIAPIFNLKKDSVGIYNSNYNNTADKKLLQKTDYYKERDGNEFALGIYEKTKLYKSVIDSIAPDKIFIYSTTETYKSEISSFGKYYSECLEYYYYDIKADSLILNENEYLFSSKYDLDLEYTSNKKIDSLLNLEYIDICIDCPMSWGTQKTFAKLKGFENLYFSYVLESNENGEGNYTPLRAIHYVDDNFVIELWSSSIDLFGCSCL
ncbi:MAG: hypothetical protein R6V36_00475, partial [Psychroflexus sp.]